MPPIYFRQEHMARGLIQHTKGAFINASFIHWRILLNENSKTFCWLVQLFIAFHDGSLVVCDAPASHPGDVSPIPVVPHLKNQYNIDKKLNNNFFT
jgi:hypothetical protein